MFLKALKVVKEVAIGILLVLSLWLVVNAALKGTTNHFDFGSLSDWVSSLSTFGTLVVAYMAYKAVPDWIKRKNVEDGSSIAIKLICKDINNAETEINRVSNCLNSMIKLVKSRNGFYAKRKNDVMITTFHKSMVKLADLSDEINASLVELHRFGWNLKDEYNEDLLEFLGNKWDIDMFDENIEYFYYSIESHKRNEIGDFTDFTLEESIDEFKKETAELKPLLEEWTKAIKKISCTSGTYDSFFNINK